MAAPEITPEIVRAVADWYEAQNPGLGIGVLRNAADRFEREQSDTERIDRYAQAFIEAAPGAWAIEGSTLNAGIRGLLALLESEGRLVAESETVEEQPSPWATLADVPDKVTYVYRDTPAGPRATFRRHLDGWLNEHRVTVGDNLAGPFDECPF